MPAGEAGGARDEHAHGGGGYQAPPRPPRKGDGEAMRTVNRVLWSRVRHLSCAPGRAYPHVMAVPRRLAALCAAIVAVLALGAAVAAAAPAPRASMTRRLAQSAASRMGTHMP